MAATLYVIAFSVFVFLSAVNANDLRLGFAQTYSRKIFSDIREASPALWKRTDEVTVNTTGNDVVTAVYVTDLRDDKDGEAYIENGGISLRSVTIGLKSPTILRGYKFLIEVFAADPTARYYSKGGQNAPYYEDTQYATKS